MESDRDVALSSPFPLPPLPAHICVFVVNRLSAPCPFELGVRCDVSWHQERDMTVRLVSSSFSVCLLISGYMVMI